MSCAFISKQNIIVYTWNGLYMSIWIFLQVYLIYTKLHIDAETNTGCMKEMLFCEDNFIFFISFYRVTSLSTVKVEKSKTLHVYLSFSVATMSGKILYFPPFFFFSLQFTQFKNNVYVTKWWRTPLRFKTLILSLVGQKHVHVRLG